MPAYVPITSRFLPLRFYYRWNNFPSNSKTSLSDLIGRKEGEKREKKSMSIISFIILLLFLIKRIIERIAREQSVRFVRSRSIRRKKKIRGRIGGRQALERGPMPNKISLEIGKWRGRGGTLGESKRFRFPSGIYLYANTSYRDINQVRQGFSLGRKVVRATRGVEGGERKKEGKKGEEEIEKRDEWDGSRLDRWNDDPFPLKRISTALFSRWSRAG